MKPSVLFFGLLITGIVISPTSFTYATNDHTLFAQTATITTLPTEQPSLNKVDPKNETQPATIHETYATVALLVSRTQTLIERLDTKSIDITSAKSEIEKASEALMSAKKLLIKNNQEKALIELTAARTHILESITEAKKAIFAKTIRPQ